MNNQMFDIIIFEGVDKIGKTTLKKHLEKITNYKYIMIDRLYMSAIVYEELKKRKNDIDYYLRSFKKLCDNFNVLLIYLRPLNIDNVKNNIKKKGDEIVDLNEVEKLFNIYEKYANDFYDNNLIGLSGMSILSIAFKGKKEIAKLANHIKERYYL